MLVMVCRFRESASPMHRKYNAKSADTRQIYVRELASMTIDGCNLVTHSMDQKACGSWSKTQILNPVDSSKLRLGPQHLRSSNRECRNGGVGNKGMRRRRIGNSKGGRTTELTNSKQRARIFLPPTWRTPQRHRVESDGTRATTSRLSDPLARALVAEMWYIFQGEGLTTRWIQYHQTMMWNP
jgi:hypothetical protein